MLLVESLAVVASMMVDGPSPEQIDNMIDMSTRVTRSGGKLD